MGDEQVSLLNGYKGSWVGLCDRARTYMSTNKIAVIFVLGTALASLDVDSAAAADDIVVTSAQQARQLEAQGEFTVAGDCWLTTLQGNASTLPDQTKVLFGRRAVACLSQAASQWLSQNGPDADYTNCQAIMRLHDAYAEMRRLEPSNPAWPYLEATYLCATGQYIEAERYLQAAAKTSGGSETARQKARTLLSHIQGYARQDTARLNSEVRSGQQFLQQWQQKWGSLPSPSDAPAGKSRDELAKERAEFAGDHDAAAHLGAGTASESEKSRYGY